LVEVRTQPLDYSCKVFTVYNEAARLAASKAFNVLSGLPLTQCLIKLLNKISLGFKISSTNFDQQSSSLQTAATVSENEASICSNKCGTTPVSPQPLPLAS